MSKLSTFFRTIHKSLFSLAYYRDVVNSRFKFSLKYFIAFSVFLGILLTVLISFIITPSINQFVNRFETRAASLYPANLVITVKNSEVSTNSEQPVKFPIPFELFTDTPPAISDQKQQYLLVIDPSAKTDSYPQSQAIILVTKNALVTENDQNGYKVYPLSDANLTVDKTQVDQFLAKVLPLLNYLPAFIITIILCALVIFLPLSRLFSLVFQTLILLTITKLMNLNLSYKKIYQIGLHALTLPTLIQILMTAFNLNPPIPFFNSLLLILWTLVIFAELKKPAPNNPTETLKNASV